MVSMSLSELSVVLFVKNNTPVRQDRHLLFSVGGITVLWTTIAVIVNAAQCGSPTPWNYLDGQCINRVRISRVRFPRYCLEADTKLFQVVWWNCVEVMDSLINVALIAVPVLIVWKVQVSRLKRFSMGLVFTLRIT